ncbi:DarT1-associated NADAR antitoxin family protein [Sphingomonas sp. UYP23]
MINFRWHAGMAASQKKKNVIELHDAAHARGMEHLLEISSKSEREIGRKLSAFHQKIIINKKEIILECAFQGSKVFRDGGPFPDLFDLDPREAKRDSRLKESGPLQGFRFDGQDFPLDPPTVFYDWLYINAILPARSWLQRLGKMDGFTDIEFNPERSINCQAYSCALFISLEKRGKLDQAISSFPNFLAASKGGVI